MVNNVKVKFHVKTILFEIMLVYHVFRLKYEKLRGESVTISPFSETKRVKSNLLVIVKT